MNRDRPAGEQGSFDSVQDMYFLVFELDGQSYGVAVEQVEAVVESEDCGRPAAADQASAPALWHYEGEEILVEPLARLVGLPRSGEVPTRLLLSRSSGPLRGFLVDTPRDIVTLPVDSIFPLPALIRRVLGPSPLWGVGRLPDGLLLLVDLSWAGREKVAP